MEQVEDQPLEQEENYGEEIAIDNYEIGCAVTTCTEKVQIEMTRPAGWECTGIALNVICPGHQVNGSIRARRGTRGRGRPGGRAAVRPRGFHRKSVTINPQNLAVPTFLGTETDYLPPEEQNIEGLLEAVDEAFEAVAQFAPEPEPEPEPEPVAPSPPPLPQPTGESKVKKRREARMRRVRETPEEVTPPMIIPTKTLQEEFPDLISVPAEEEPEEEPAPVDPELEMRKKAARQREIMARQAAEAEREETEEPLQIPKDANLEDMLKKDLIKLCKQLGMSVSGNKNNLIKKIGEYRDRAAEGEDN